MKNSISVWVFVAIFLLLLGFAGYIIAPYAGAIFIGALISYFLYPVYRSLSARLHSDRWAGVVLSLLSVLVLLGTLALLVPSFISQATLVYNSAEPYVQEQIVNIRECSTTSGATFVCKTLDKVLGTVVTPDFQEKGIEVVKQAAVFLAQNTGRVLGSVVSIVVSIFIMIFSIFYFLDRGPALKDAVLEILPLKDSHEGEIYSYLRKAIEAVVIGNIGTSALQGLAGGLIFFGVGLPAAVFWGFVMGIAAFIPALGPALVFVPAAIILAVQGSYIKAILILVLCFLILGYIDNVLKPRIIGKRIKLASFVVFLGVLGGLATMGILGMFVGPLVLALVAVFVELYRRDLTKPAITQESTHGTA